MFKVTFVFLFNYSSFEVGKTVDEMLVGCLWQGDNIMAVALSGYIYYFNKNDPSTPLKVTKVLLDHFDII